MSELLKDKIERLRVEAQNLHANTAEEVEALRQKYLSKKGDVSLLFDDFKALTKEQKAQWGASVNQLKQQFESQIKQMREQMESKVQTVAYKEDLTRTPDSIGLGARHPLSLVREQIITIFSRIGFTVADGPEVEDDKHVFGMLNFAPEHPARDMQDTFFVEKQEGVQKPTDILLRTHTSSVQTRALTDWAKALNNDPANAPQSLRILCPGRVFRNEAISARAHCFFHQVEGLYVDKNVNFADLRQALLYFAKEMFGPDTQIRLRPSYFPFTEPSVEVDISCCMCHGKGCRS